jgi:hypothetical protein
MFDDNEISDIKILCREFIMAKEIMEYGCGETMFNFYPTFLYEPAYINRILPYDYCDFIRGCSCARKYQHGNHGSFDSFLISISDKFNDRYKFLESETRWVIDPDYDKDLMHSDKMRYLTAAKILSTLRRMDKSKGGEIRMGQNQGHEFCPTAHGNPAVCCYNEFAAIMFFKRLEYLHVLHAPSLSDSYCDYILNVDRGKLENFTTQYMARALQRQQQPINFKRKITWTKFGDKGNEIDIIYSENGHAHPRIFEKFGNSAAAFWYIVNRPRQAITAQELQRVCDEYGKTVADNPKASSRRMANLGPSGIARLLGLDKKDAFAEALTEFFSFDLDTVTFKGDTLFW